MSHWNVEQHKQHSKELQMYKIQLVQAYADSFAEDVIFRGVVPSVANRITIETCTGNYNTRVEQVVKMNDTTRQIHSDECMHKKAAEEQYKLVTSILSYRAATVTPVN